MSFLKLIKCIFLLLFFLLYFSVLSVTIEASATSLSSIESSYQKPFVLELHQKFTNPFVTSDGKYIIFQPEPQKIEIYDFYNNLSLFEYTVTGSITSIADSATRIAVGTDKGEVIVFDKLTQSFMYHRFEAGFGSVAKLYVSLDRYVSVLFSDGSFVLYDIQSDGWFSYRPMSSSSTTEAVSNYQFLNFWGDGPNLVILAKPIFQSQGKIFLKLIPQDNLTKVSGLRVIANFTKSRTVLTSTTDSNGTVSFDVPQYESTDSQVLFFIESQSFQGFSYLVSARLADILNTVFQIPYPSSSYPLVLTPFVSNNYVLYLASPSQNGLQFQRSFPFQCDSVIGLSVLDNSLGIKYLLFDNFNSSIEVLMLSSSLDYMGRSTFYKAGPVSFASTTSGSFAMLGYPDGTLIVLQFKGGSYYVFHSYKLSGTPILLTTLSSSPLEAVAVDSSFVYALKYSDSLKSLVPILRNSNSLGFPIPMPQKAYLSPNDFLFIFSDSGLVLVDGFSYIFSYDTLDLNSRRPFTVVIQVYGADGKVVSGANVSLIGNLVYSSNTDESGLSVFQNVFPGAYNLTVIPVSPNYDAYSAQVNLTTASTINVTLPLHIFSLKLSIIDTYTNSTPIDNMSYSLISNDRVLQRGIISNGVAVFILTYGTYRVVVEPVTYIFLYKTTSLTFDVPVNGSIVLSMTRSSYPIAVQVVDSATGKPAQGNFLVEIKDTTGRVYNSTTGFETNAIFNVLDVGNFTVYVIPNDNVTSSIYMPSTTTLSVIGSMNYHVYVNRKAYNLTVKLVDGDSGSIPQGVTLFIDGAQQNLTGGTFVAKLLAGQHKIEVKGPMYQDFAQQINLVQDSILNVSLSRKLSQLVVVVLSSQGSPIAGAKVEINGIDNLRSYFFITDPTGQISIFAPYGTYMLNASAVDFNSASKVVTLSSGSFQQELVLSPTLLGYFKMYGVYLVVAVVAVVLILYMRRYVKKRLELLLQEEAGEVF